jgi:hypothetical protein
MAAQLRPSRDAPREPQSRFPKCGFGMEEAQRLWRVFRHLRIQMSPVSPLHTRANGRGKAYNFVAILCSARKPRDRIQAPSAKADASIKTSTVPHSTGLHISVLVFGMAYGV